MPYAAEELAQDAFRCRLAGASAVHVHPRTPDGTQTLDPETCAAAIERIGSPVGLSTGAFIRGGRAAEISAWRVLPDFCSVNFAEEDALEICELLLGKGIGVEAGLSSEQDAERLRDSSLAHLCLRVLVEVSGDGQVEQAAAIEHALAGLGVPQLHHGDGRSTWVVIERALRRRHDIRIGLEDTLVLADGRVARDNSQLVARAARL